MLTAPTGIEAATATDLDAAVRQVAASKRAWVETDASGRERLLRAAIRGFKDACDEYAAAGVAIKGSYGSGMGEELVALLPALMYMDEMAEAMKCGGTPPVAGTRPGPAGRTIVDVFPMGLVSLLFSGIKGEMWTQPGKPASQGRLYREKASGTCQEDEAGVVLVLGAGNHGHLGVTDVLHALFVFDKVAVLKISPVLSSQGRAVERLLQPFVDEGFVRVVQGGVAEGKLLVAHSLVNAIHVTGSPKTFDAIVWGDNKAKTGKPTCTKPVTGELGCVTPYIIIPGPWTDADYDYHAQEVCAGLVANSGHNCLTPEVLITPRAWSGRKALMAAIKHHLNKTRCRMPWYPGAEAAIDAFRKRFPDALELGVREDERTRPWLLAEGLSPDDAKLDAENWAGVLQEVQLDGSTEEYMRKATQVANERCFGTLSCSVWAHPSTQTEHAEAFGQMIESLRYGTICVNVSALPGYGITRCMWGAFTRDNIEDIGSGNCGVHNTTLLDFPEKSVIRGAWRQYPKPCWWPSHTNSENLAHALYAFFANASMRPISINNVVPPAVLSS